jgi:beta-galactosidase
MGCNAVRTAHHPHSEALMNMCDTMGLFVMDEFIDEWTVQREMDH